jgi:hypothetical protein
VDESVPEVGLAFGLVEGVAVRSIQPVDDRLQCGVEDGGLVDGSVAGDAGGAVGAPVDVEAALAADASLCLLGVAVPRRRGLLRSRRAGL